METDQGCVICAQMGLNSVLMWGGATLQDIYVNVFIEFLS